VLRGTPVPDHREDYDHAKGKQAEDKDAQNNGTSASAIG